MVRPDRLWHILVLGPQVEHIKTNETRCDGVHRTNYIIVIPLRRIIQRLAQLRDLRLGLAAVPPSAFPKKFRIKPGSSLEIIAAPDPPARVRFAPSPTGYLHLGGLRTALFNYLLAKQTKGDFILRIEDTDQARTVEGAVEHLQKMLSWTGLEFDEGPKSGGKYGPYIQSQRSELYREKAQELLEQGKAYRCFCTPERLENVRAMAKRSGRTIGYDQHCRHLTAEEIAEKMRNGEPHTVRFKVMDGKTTMQDLVHGQIDFNNRALDDTIILKSDGLPTYHLANVVDDHLMKITHVLRGEEWVSSTPKHLLLYKAFGWKAPLFAHLPLLVNRDGSKLSKRQGDVHIEALLAKGYLPEALLNFVAFLGWGPGSTKELYTLDELVKDFKFDNINKSPAIVAYEKLNHFNKLHIGRRLANAKQRDELVSRLQPILQKEFESRLDAKSTALLANKEYLTTVILAVKERIRLLTEVPQFALPFFVAPNYGLPDAIKYKDSLDAQLLENVVKTTRERVAAISDDTWTPETVKDLLNGTAAEHGGEYMSVVKALRYAVTGTKVGVDMVTILHILGRERTLERLDVALREGDSSSGLDIVDYVLIADILNPL
ncbi:Glutamyl-tRNA synthetase [Geranomyces variabilis]|nr:Glutamyl-tRNA synthetase [Geranomyces variabilis]